jgi:hypothetical protein
MRRRIVLRRVAAAAYRRDFTQVKALKLNGSIRPFARPFV